jgi:hypothetical protein
MSDAFGNITPYNDGVQYIPKNLQGDQISPIEYYIVTEADIDGFYDEQNDIIKPISDGAIRIGITGGVGTNAGGVTTSPSVDDLIPRIQVSSLEPLTRNVNEGSTITFTVSAFVKNNVNEIPTYQWQKSDSGSNIWSNIVGATGSSYTTNIVSFANDHLDRYRCIVSATTASNSPFETDAITLNVRRIITITSQPVAQPSYFSGQTATFTVGANISSGIISYQWQKKDFGTFSFVSISGATNPSYTTPTLNLTEYFDDSYRCVLSNPNADTKITDEIVLIIEGADLKLTPAVSGVTFWSFKDNGPLILDPSNSESYKIECLIDNKNIKTDMWGQGSCNARGGYSSGIVPLASGSGYTVKLNAGRGTGGNPGGGYAGLFETDTVIQTNALLIAGGAGGGGASTTAACTYSGGTGGGLVGGDAFSIPGVGGGTSATYQASAITSNPACAGGPNYGWYTRSGGTNTNSVTGDIRQLVIKWDGAVIYNGSVSNITNGYIAISGYRYYPSTYRSTSYGWCADGTTCGSCSTPNGDYGNSFDIYRSAIDTYEGGKGGTQTNSGAGGSGFGQTVTETFSTAGTSTITIPSGAANITYEIIGGRGGRGGTGVKGGIVNGTYPGGTGANGQKITGSFNSSVIGQTLTITVAANGGNGSAAWFGASGGSGGSGLNSGGSGGSTPVTNDPDREYYGASGGGGGGSSSISISTTRVLIAGGGGGGGGGMNFSIGSGINGKTSTTIATALSASNGGTGGIPSASFNSAGGGGGAGSPGGLGGDGSQAGNSIAGEGGSGGNGYRNTTYVSDASVSTSTTNAYVKITYTIVANDGINGTSLQGGNGGAGTYSGGGGGGGYFGGGGGAGFGDRSTGGGGGSGFVAATVSGTTSTFVSTVSGVSRGTAGDINGNSRVVFNYAIITINTQPSLNTSYNIGDSATMSVAATITSGTINYQWQYKPIGGEWQNISGANSSTYTISSISLNNSFETYRCVLSNVISNTIYTNEVVLYVIGADIQISPAVQGRSFWSFIDHGKLILDASNATTYTITVINSGLEKISAKMWGQGTCNATGGFTRGTISVSTGNTYTVKLNAGAGAGGQSFGSTSSDPGGGYAGLFTGSTISQQTALLIAGGAGGAGRNANSCERSGGLGGGSAGTSGESSSNSEACAQGGAAGSQFSGGSAGSGCGYNDIWGSNNIGTSGSALQGGRGGLGDYNLPDTNAPGGGGGGGGYFGGGGGAGGNDYGNGTRSGGGGGGGSGFVANSITNGRTEKFSDSLESIQDPDRGSAGGIASQSRVVVDQVSEYYTDASGRILILSATNNRDPRTLLKTKGRVLPGTNTCIDNARWQSLLNLASSTNNYRLAVTLNQSPIAILRATDYNLHKLKNFNRLAIKNSLTAWDSFIYGYRLAWDENSGDEGVGSDYSGLFWSPGPQYPGWAYYALSTNAPFLDSYSYGHPSADWWILPPGVSDFPSQIPVTTVTGQQSYTSPGTYTWTAPAGVNDVSVVCIGGGGGGGPNNGGNGGSLGWKNNIPVIPGQTYTVVVGRGGYGGSNDFSYRKGEDSYFINLSTVGAQGSGGLGQLIGEYYGAGGGRGGSGYWGGGGAGGYAGNGGGFNGISSITPTGGAGGCGGNGSFPSGDGGGVGIFGQGSDGFNAVGGGAGGAGSGGSGNLYGGGGGVGDGNFGGNNGGGGAVRIIWGPNRQFPSTNTQNL